MTIPSDLPSFYAGAGTVDVFNVPTTVTNLEWHIWNKPRGISTIYLFTVGGGAGGGGGFTGIATSARGGGGSGGSSAVTRSVFPAFLLPDRLYIQVGAGGLGVGSGGGTAGTGIKSFVSVYPDLNVANLLSASASSAPTGGGTGTAAAVGGAGVGGTVPTITVQCLAGLGVFTSIAGQAGVAGGAVAGAVGTAGVIPVTGVVTSGGSGGAGTTSADFAGGLWTAISNSYLSEIRPATPAAGSFNGSAGFNIWQPFFSFGGTGGSSSNSGVGGNGGIGGYGSGGGGGGGGTTGGKGGDGGGGLVVIVSC